MKESGKVIDIEDRLRWHRKYECPECDTKLLKAYSDIHSNNLELRCNKCMRTLSEEEYYEEWELRLYA